MAAAETDDEEILSSINVTPLVDIFLVLLIILMITSTIAEHTEIPVNVPRAAKAGKAAPKGCSLVLDRKDQLYLNGIPVDITEAAGRLRSLAASDSVHHVLISADEDLPYRRVVNLIDLVHSSGISKYALKVVRQK